MDTPCSDADLRSSDFSRAFRDIHDNMAGLERALHDEVDRRIASEDRIREQVDAKVKIAIERLADLTETEMARMYRRIEADVMDRLDSLSRDVASLSSSITKLNRQVELLTVETRENADSLSKLEETRVVSRGGESVRSERSTGAVAERGKDELMKLHNIIENDMTMSKKLDELSNVVNLKLMLRVETMEDWLKGNLTPEMLRLKEAIKSERLLREDNDREIMQIVGQYTEVMRRHFKSSDEKEGSFEKSNISRMLHIGRSEQADEEIYEKKSQQDGKRDSRNDAKESVASSVSKFMNFGFRTQNSRPKPTISPSVEGSASYEESAVSETGGRRNLDNAMRGGD